MSNYPEDRNRIDQIEHDVLSCHSDNKFEKVVHTRTMTRGYSINTAASLIPRCKNQVETSLTETS